MATIKQSFAAAQSITITLDSLASSATAGRESTAVDNTTNLYVDALVSLKITYPNLAPANHKGLYLFAYSWDGTDYTGGATGSDAAYTFDDITTTAPAFALLGFVTLVQNKTRYSQQFSVASCFGGILPSKWGLACLNYSGQTLSTGCTARYIGVSYTVN